MATSYLFPDSSSSQKKKLINAQYESWFCTDQLVRSWLLGTLSEECLGLTQFYLNQYLILYVAEGTVLAGFITSTEDGNRLFTKTLNPADLIVFPMGLIHFAFNVGKGPVVVFGLLNTQNPGTNFIANTVFGSNPPINPDFLARAFQLDPKIVMDQQIKF
ncbi:hypothetical protein AALP_AA6G345600 [Arabis alpina]|uniref:Germin-like protein n=1 Tax=Arabis alpina TaxID=50452 RepID=A0A087GTL4_ARAAL|nr:hypothetical protein AALP_AA6G345600 [Arabis alpina]